MHFLQVHVREYIVRDPVERNLDHGGSRQNKVDDVGDTVVELARHKDRLL